MKSIIFQKCYLAAGSRPHKQFRARDTFVKHRPNKFQSHCIQAPVNAEWLTETRSRLLVMCTCILFSLIFSMIEA
jgi:hypothetical protein